MLRPGNLFALSLRGTFVDTLLHTDLSVRRYHSYEVPWRLPRPGFHRRDSACLAGHTGTKKSPAGLARDIWCTMLICLIALDLHDYGHYHGAPPGDLKKMLTKFVTDLGFDDRPFGNVLAG